MLSVLPLQTSRNETLKLSGSFLVALQNCVCLIARSMVVQSRMQSANNLGIAQQIRPRLHDTLEA